MPKFYTPYNPAPRKAAPSGSPIRDTYGEVLDEETGKIVIGKTGSENMYEMTQEAKPVDLYDLIEGSGVDPVLLSQKIEIDEQLVNDFTSMPRTLAEAHMMIIKGQRAYDELPVQVRDEFGSPAALLSSLSDGSFRKRMEKFLPQQEVKDESK